MKTIMIILDGVSEESSKELLDTAPLDYAYTPTLNKIINAGVRHKKKFYPNDKEPDSLNCILSILGVKNGLIPRNRAYLESLAAGINVKDDEVVLRCNLVSVDNDKLTSFNAMGLTNAEKYYILENIKKNMGIKFYHISDYRNLIVMKKSDENLNLLDMPPHENVGQSVDYLLKNMKNIGILNRFIEENIFKVKDKHFMFYPWGVSEKTMLPTFFGLYNKSCSCICSAEIVKGIAIAMKIDLVKLKNSTGDTDTDLSEKAEAVLNEIKTKDIVIAHINGTDEVSHRKDMLGKIKFIEKIDREFLNKIYINVEKKTELVILADHQTSSITGKHEKGFVDVIRTII